MPDKKYIKKTAKKNAKHATKINIFAGKISERAQSTTIIYLPRNSHNIAKKNFLVDKMKI